MTARYAEGVLKGGHNSWSASVYNLCLYIGPDDLSAVLFCLEQQGLVARWKKIGVLLKVRFADLEVIKQNEDDVEDRMMSMLNKWLTSGRASKQALANALQRLS